MAEHGRVEYATAGGNDLPEHEATYERFVHLVVVIGAHLVNIVLGLAIGGVAGSWMVALTVMILATFVAIHGLATGSRAPSVVMVVIALIALALTSGSGGQHA
jgi:hypothetical protein